MPNVVRLSDVSEQESTDVAATVDGQARDMITPLLRQSLEKQGYRLIGSHSGVKLCRWTKVLSAL